MQNCTSASSYWGVIHKLRKIYSWRRGLTKMRTLHTFSETFHFNICVEGGLKIQILSVGTLWMAPYQLIGNFKFIQKLFLHSMGRGHSIYQRLQRTQITRVRWHNFFISFFPLILPVRFKFIQIGTLFIRQWLLFYEFEDHGILYVH